MRDLVDPKKMWNFVKNLIWGEEEEEERNDQHVTKRNKPDGGREKEKETNHFTGRVTQFDKTTSSGMIDNIVYFDLSVVMGGIKPQVNENDLIMHINNYYQ